MGPAARGPRHVARGTWPAARRRRHISSDAVDHLTLRSRAAKRRLAGVARAATRGPRGSSPALSSPALLPGPQLKRSAQDVLRLVSPIWCTVRNVHPDPRAGTPAEVGPDRRARPGRSWTRTSAVPGVAERAPRVWRGGAGRRPRVWRGRAGAPGLAWRRGPAPPGLAWPSRRPGSGRAARAGAPRSGVAEQAPLGGAGQSLPVVPVKRQLPSRTAGTRTLPRKPFRSRRSLLTASTAASASRYDIV